MIQKYCKGHLIRQQFTFKIGINHISNNVDYLIEQMERERQNAARRIQRAWRRYKQKRDQERFLKNKNAKVVDKKRAYHKATHVLQNPASSKGLNK